MSVTMPSFLLRDIFGNEHARALLLHLAEQAEPIPYSESRRRLRLHPQQFQRALDQLESHGLVGLTAPDDIDKEHAQRRYRVFLEPTALGTFCADLWERMNADYSQLAAEREIPEEALAASATGD